MTEPAPYDRCIRCGLCLPSCPTYLETLTETSGPRGRIALMKAVAEGQADPLSPGFTEQMSQCLGCRACEAACPSGVEYGRLLESARAGIREAAEPSQSRGSRAARGFLLGLVAHLERLRAAAVVLRAAQRSGLLQLVPARLAHLARLAPRIAARFFIPDGRRVDAAPSQGLAFLHAGCIMQVAFPNVHEAATRMLARAGLSVVVPPGQGCCGAIAAHAGEPALARELAKRNIAAFEASGADVYVADAAGCSAALKEYRIWFQDDPQWAQRALSFSQRVRDVTEVLDAMPLEPPPGRLDATVTYQEPCHLAHAQRVTGAPRRLLRKIPGLDLVEMDESALCCGSAGVYNLTQPAMARRLQRRKSENVRRTRATIVATANPGCAIQVAAGLRECGYAADVRHVVELLDDAYRSEAATPSR